MHDAVFKPDTEPIFARVSRLCEQLRHHPLLVAAGDATLPPPLLRELAFLQYADSILWIPMLAQLKSKATRSVRLRRAIEDNISCEAGLGSVSHVQLAVDLMRSIPDVDTGAVPLPAFREATSWWLSNEFAAASEAWVVGWLLAAESLVPVLFAGVLPAYRGCDTRYFSEHVAVDGDEHAAWMRESLDDVFAVYGAGCVADVERGIDDAWQETISVPDALWKTLQA